MIRHTTGNLLTADADALVNTVNTAGVAGKGIALQFRQAYPDNFKAYSKAAKNNEVVPGRMYVYATSRLQPRYIINFPTKRHWRGASKISDIVSGLKDLAATIQRLGITSIAVPPLGCGNGGLSWAEVRPLIVHALGELNVEVLLFAPEGAPSAESMPVATERPKMTLGRAVMLLLMDQYRDIDEYRLSALEAQKLAYFMQEGGEPLRLDFTKARFGPYAENLNHVLRVMDGHFIRGYGDRSRQPMMRLLPGVADEARHALKNNTETRERLARVASLLEDWDTPYGLELLSTVHWALTHVEPPVRDLDALVEYVSNWTPRKADLFKASQIERAARHLETFGFARLPAPVS